MDVASLFSFLERGGIVIWAIAALSLFTLTLIFWKMLRLARLGVWGGAKAERAVEEFRRAGVVPEDGGGGLRFQASWRRFWACWAPFLV